MEKLKEIKRAVYKYLFDEKFDKYIKKGLIKKFDADFYARFYGMYYNGLPIYYYLEKRSMGECYDASAILALAMGKKANVCRGELKTMSNIFPAPFGHGWVECEDFVYDTTWKVILDKKLYYKLFGVIDETVRTNEKFFDDCKKMSDWTIHTKEYYENNYVPLVNLGIFQVHQLTELILKSQLTSETDRKFYEKLKNDLPAYEKLILMPNMEEITDISGVSGSKEQDEPEC